MKDKIVLDVGASTGGFTDCALQYGAKKVWAIDVGTNQLVWKIRNDARVVSLEKTHIRDWNTCNVHDKFDLILIDVSFISLISVIEWLQLKFGNKETIALYKPQFEIGRNDAGFTGVVNDLELIETGLADFQALVKKNGYKVSEPYECSIKGAKGNREYFFYLK